MCLIIDPGCLPIVFEPTNPKHKNFKPVLTWLKKKNTKMIYGGTLYRKELSKLPNYFNYLKEIQTAGKLIQLKDSEVDLVQKDLKIQEPSKKFDDPHLIAIAIVSNCKIICTCDDKATKYIRNKKFYSPQSLRPSIFTGKKNNHKLLCAKNITGMCK